MVVQDPYQPSVLHQTPIVSVSAGQATLSGNLVPSSSNTYSLGAPGKLWRGLYVGPGTITIAGLTGSTAVGTIGTDANSIANPGRYNLSFNGQLVTIGTPTVTAWFRQNGINITGSAYRLATSAGNALMVFNQFVNPTLANTQYQVMWLSYNDAGSEHATLTPFAAAVLTVNQIG